MSKFGNSVLVLDSYIKGICLGTITEPIEACVAEALDEHLDAWIAERVNCVSVGVNSEDHIRQVCAEAGLAGGFVDGILSGYDGAYHGWRTQFPNIPLPSSDYISHRAIDVIATVTQRSKPAFCPFTATGVMLRDTVNLHTFLYRHNNQSCLFLPDWRIDHPISDRTWFFPESGLLLSSMPGFDGRIGLKRTLSLMIRNIERVVEYLADPNRTVMVSEDGNGHIGHYIWNVVSGWSHLFRSVDPQMIDTITSYKNWQIFGGVTELYEKEISPTTAVFRTESEDEIFEIMLNNRAISLMIRDRYITDDLASRLIDWSWHKCEPDFRNKVEDLRTHSWPLVMITIRTDNRAWIEQVEGYASIINALRADYPDIGIVIDGINCGMDQVGSHGLMSVNDEQAIAEAIINACPNVRFFNSIGCFPHESITLAIRIDAFLAPIGAGLAKTRWVVTKPGVGFSNETFMKPGNYDGYLYNHFRVSSVPMRYVHPSDVKDVDDIRHNEKGRVNFSMSWEAPLRELRHILSQMPQR